MQVLHCHSKSSNNFSCILAIEIYCLCSEFFDNSRNKMVARYKYTLKYMFQNKIFQDNYLSYERQSFGIEGIICLETVYIFQYVMHAIFWMLHDTIVLSIYFSYVNQQCILTKKTLHLYFRINFFVLVRIFTFYFGM